MAEDFKEKAKRFVKRDLLFVSVVGIIAAVAVVFIADRAFHSESTGERQEALQPFYTPPSPLPDGQPGDVIRKERLEIDVPADGEAYRILYLSQRSDSSLVAASGMVFYPSGDSPEGGRPIVAWAHPTTGMGEDCAPSRWENPLSDMSWLEDMLSRGWVVTATDYAGLGTPGIEHYLVGRDEARDVINSVRAARWVSEAKAGPNYAVWGHSQGGHAALFTETEAGTYAPELNLVGVAVAAPAAELATLIDEQYKSEVGWVIGPEVLISWPDVYHDISVEAVTTASGLRKYQDIADDCLVSAGEEAKVRSELKMDFFKINPISVPSWYNAATSETPDIASGAKPIFIAQGLDDQVVIPETTALLVQRYCRAGVDLTTIWLGETGHEATAKVAAPSAITWLDDRFHNKPTQSSCNQPLPVKPSEPAAAPSTSS